MLQTILFLTTPSLEIFLEYFLILFFLRDTHLFLCILYFFSLSLVEFLQKLFLNLLLCMYRLSQFLVHKRGLISSDKSFFQRCMTFEILLKVSVMKR